jgi:glycosyltransferase involved in cell wall biosynthesis
LAQVKVASKSDKLAPATHSTFIAAVAPIYRGAEFVEALCERLKASLASVNEDYRIVLVDDGSPDDAWARITEQTAQDPRILGVQLSRNFGQHYAITAGLDHVDAEWIVVLDGDLQDLPEDIPLLYQKAISEDFDVVIAERTIREDPYDRKLGSSLFNKALSYLSGLDLSSQRGNFRIMSRKVHEAFSEVREHMRFYPAIMQWLGFRIGHQETHRPPRSSGQSSYDFRRLLRLAIEATIAYSERPLHISIVLGLLISLAAFCVGGAVVIRKLLWGIDAAGWTSVITLISFLGGLQIFLLGIVGLYVGKLFQEAKKRPLYIVRALSQARFDRDGGSGDNSSMQPNSTRKDHSQ